MAGVFLISLAFALGGWGSISYFLFHKRLSKLRSWYRSLDSNLRLRHSLLLELATNLRQSNENQSEAADRLEGLYHELSANYAKGGPLSERFAIEYEVGAQIEFLRQNELLPEQEADKFTPLQEDIELQRLEYNAVTIEYNKSVQYFPSNIPAMVFNFHLRPPFETPEERQKRERTADVRGILEEYQRQKQERRAQRRAQKGR